MKGLRTLLSLLSAVVLVFCVLSPAPVSAQSTFEEALIDVGNIGITISNSGFFGRAGVRNNPTGAPSFEYPRDSGIEHLFEAGLWVGAIRSDGVVTVRTGAVTRSSGYAPGAQGYEFAPHQLFLERSTLLNSDVYTRQAISHQDLFTSYVDTSSVLPTTQIPMPDPEGRLGAHIIQKSYAWNFPFTEFFSILEFDIVNISDAAWDSVYVGIFHDLVVRNINTTQDVGSNFFNKNGVGYLDSLLASYAFNAGGAEETINTYGAIVILGAEWKDPRTGQKRFFHPDVADSYERDGYARPVSNPRWWSFSGGTAELARPTGDEEKYRRMATPYPNRVNYETEEAYLDSYSGWRNRLRTDGLISAGNWIGLTPIGPFPRVLSGDTLKVTFAFIGALKPEEFQGDPGKPIDTDDSRSLLVNNIKWARRTYSGEDNNYNGALDPGEDINSNGRLDRFLIPEPPSAPRMRTDFDENIDPVTGRQQTRVTLFWDRSSEMSIDPVTGEYDFDGYRIYRSNPGDDRAGNILDATKLIAQYDKPGNRNGFNNGFDEIRLTEPVTFADDTTRYYYRFDAGNLLSGWQYLFTVTAFDTGDPDAGLDSFESSRTANATRVFPGTPPATDESKKVGVYPNPYRANAAWDGGTSRTRKLNFYNLPARAVIRIYTLAGEVVTELEHDTFYAGDTRWYDDFSAENRQFPGGEHSWDLLSDNDLNLAGGLYLFTVKNLDTGEVQQGKFVIIK